MADPDWRRVLGMVGERAFDPPPPRLPEGPAIVPEPRSARLDGWTPVDQEFLGPFAGPRGPVDLLTRGLRGAGVPTADGGGYPVTFVDEPGAGRGPEDYALRAERTGMEVRAATVAGLARGAATARQLIRPATLGIEVLAGEIDDGPVVPLRLLAGWGLYRDHRLEWALEVAAEGKFNRVLYNWWTATAGERMGRREEHLVELARSVGIELVVELRRQALGPTFSFSDPGAVDVLLRHYDDAADRGFRSFGFLFDDTDHDPFENELGLLADLVGHLTDRLGEEPEFFFCPRFYWFPGQMDYSWMAAAMAGEDGPSMAPMLGAAGPRSMAEASSRQEAYQRQLGAALPARTEVYLANWWSGTPDDWAAELDDGWTARVGRAPVFWDNQQQNDFRAAVVLPVPLHQRPAGFASALRGYCLNSGVPLSAFAPASVTAGAWAWNPEGYDPAAAFGAAIQRLYGPAAPAMCDAMTAWTGLLGDLLAPRMGMEQHYRGLRRAVRGGEGGAVAARLDAVTTALTAARRALPACSHPLARDGLHELRTEVDRLRLDLELAGATSRADADRLVAAITEILVSRLPPVPELAGLDVGGPAPAEPVPGISWFLHFVAGPLRAGPLGLVERLGLDD